MLLAYLSLAPAGDHFSIRRFLSQQPAPSLSVMANISTRLIQVHLSALYLMTGLSKLGSEVWWNGEAGWWLIAQTQTRLVDLSSLREQTFAINALTHGLVLFDLLYGVFIWHRLARPLLIGASVFVWTITAVLTGLVGFACIMIAANLAFVRSDLVAEAWGLEGTTCESIGCETRVKRGVKA
jgi:hypothetical protein